MYKVGNEWKPMKVIHERFELKAKGGNGKAIGSRYLRFTDHGPVIWRDEFNRAYALKWAGSEPGGAAYLPALAVARAQNHSDFLKALERWKIPSLNFMYADKDDNIAWVAAAATPIRTKHDGLLPVPGNGGYEWAGYMALQHLPQDKNPKSGWLATANHNIIPKGYKNEIGYEFAPPYRFERVKANLDGKKKLTLEDFQRIQHDDVSIPGEHLARLLGAIKTVDPGLLRGWHGRLDRDSPQAVLFAMWLPLVQDAVYGMHVPKEHVKEVAAKSGLPTLLRVLSDPTEKWFGPNPAAKRDEILASTFQTAVREFDKRWPRRNLPRWGALHTVTFRHPLEKMSADYAKAFNIGPYERTGDANTPNNTRYDADFKQIHGATYRHVFDLADWDKGIATSAPGQSGQYGSPHYADLAPLWAKGEYFPLAYSRKMVEDVTRHKLMLRP
jgi:penicillin amidase